mmetsp:Transcript_45363/g.84227  ORF Transcript_45363/g.84227 Transcript_45363/m.84227 type:complete len:238 (-) Transcript_45363:333-1046(-)
MKKKEKAAVVQAAVPATPSTATTYEEEAEVEVDEEEEELALMLKSMELAAFLRGAGNGLEKFAGALVEQGFSDVEAVSDRELLDDATLCSALIGMDKGQVRSLRHHIEQRGTGPTMTKRRKHHLELEKQKLAGQLQGGSGGGGGKGWSKVRETAHKPKGGRRASKLSAMVLKSSWKAEEEEKKQAHEALCGGGSGVGEQGSSSSLGIAEMSQNQNMPKSGGMSPRTSREENMIGTRI